MDVDPSNPGQVDAVSSTANFKSPLSALGMGDSNDANASGCDKQVGDRRVGMLKPKVYIDCMIHLPYKRESKEVNSF